MADPVAAGGTAIHDLGYEPYRGPKTPHRGRFWIIARNVFAVAWRSKWGVRLPLFATVGTVIAASVILYVIRYNLTKLVGGRMDGMFNGQMVLFGALRFFELSAFVLATVVATGAIANDLRMGSFQFYFSRPIRRMDYMFGKLFGLVLLVGIPLFIGPVIVSLMIVLMAWSDAGKVIHLVPATMGYGLYATLAYVIPAAGLGALVQKRGPAQALYAIYYLLLSTAAVGLSFPLRFPWLRLLSINHDLDTFGRWLYALPSQMPNEPHVSAALVSLGAFVAAGLALVWWRVARAETAGLGQ
jgi:ABC-2 type transport system permease protein